ncbi:MAG: PLP-dependent aminotransferase family protein [Tabrizicola sp.]|uniref:aminotransferase-like domain-containing protein n=1 Tax=Tabrizicola sp. TaxID=2005166 RepID=UPI002737191E|nr:PLP-dependent aminotransferase family protein [Tabrizicola sp.]MDP3263189.1 PLP-dependent aminotransferase family protein [Tabrizicola sp.]MDP3646546.1 PLP-dependent aminotransferase family protein [Paracoccaceae bacterium]MDZ4069483.1 PLP-dependent aminotransferase family protein [Tabrizicola sp.]
MTDTNWAPDLSQFPGPKYLSLSRALREAIRTGDLPPNAQLPTVRDLAWRLHLTPGTVARAYQLATQEGLLAATVGRGTFVAAQAPRLGPTQALYTERLTGGTTGLVDLRPPQVAEVGQREAFRAALLAMAETTGQGWLDYTSQGGEAELRAEIVGWMGDRLLGPIGPQDVALTHGGQNAIHLILDCCLRGERPVVLIEELAYPGFRYAARAARAEVVPVEIDEQGIVPEALEAACRRHGAQVLCLTSEAQNPTTGRMPVERRQQIAEIARRYDLQVLEDDCYSVAESDIPSLRALAPERVWLVGSLSKTISAALRFGYVICPAGMGEAGRLTAQHGFFALSRPVADLCLHLFRSGDAAAIKRKVQAEFAERLQILVNHIGAFDLDWQPGVPFVWLRLPMGWRASTFTRMAEARGVLVRSADEYALVNGRAPSAVRIAISGSLPREAFERALRTLADLLANPPSDLSV